MESSTRIAGIRFHFSNSSVEQSSTAAQFFQLILPKSGLLHCCWNASKAFIVVLTYAVMLGGKTCSCTVLTSRAILPTAADSKSSCSREIRSSSLHKSGTILSPNYVKGEYPPDTLCRYRISGNESERVQISFINIDLNYPEGDPSNPEGCSRVDFVEVRLEKDQVPIGVYCGNKLPPSLMSSGNNLTVTFVSQPGSSGRGFKASYRFLTDFGIKSGQQDKKTGCSFVFKSSQSSNGTLTSPNYPGLYPRNTECTYQLDGRPGERVMLSFRHFDVDGIPPRCAETAQSDFVEIVHHKDQPPKRYCASLDDQQRKLIRTLGSSQTLVRFKSNNEYDATGFEAVYQFQREDEQTNSGGFFGFSSQATSGLIPTGDWRIKVLAAVMMCTARCSYGD